MFEWTKSWLWAHNVVHVTSIYLFLEKSSMTSDPGDVVCVLKHSAFMLFKTGIQNSEFCPVLSARKSSTPRYYSAICAVQVY